MELWDASYIDEVVPGFIHFDQGRAGEFQFGTVSGGIDYRSTDRAGRDLIEFSWEGQVDNDPGSGRGWAVIAEGQLEGRLFIHEGDDSWFIAKRANKVIARRRLVRQRLARPRR